MSEQWQPTELNRQRVYADEEARLIESCGGVVGITEDNEQRGRDAFLSGKPYQPKQTNEWCYGWLSEHNKAIYDSEKFCDDNLRGQKDCKAGKEPERLQSDAYYRGYWTQSKMTELMEDMK